MKIGRRLAIKVLNASKFALTMSGGEIVVDPAAVVVPIDRAMLAGLAGVVATATDAFERYDHTRALEVTETYFWTFCDDYLELVKDRAYNSDGAHGEGDATSARVALVIAVDTFLRLLAPVLPFATEEVWSWWRDGSVHTAEWPDASALAPFAADSDPRMLAATGAALAALRKVKSESRVSQRTGLRDVTLVVPAGEAGRIAERDLKAAGRVVGPLTIEEDPGADAARVAAHELEAE